MQYQLSEQWQLTGGFAYDTSAVSDANRTKRNLKQTGGPGRHWRSWRRWIVCLAVLALLWPADVRADETPRQVLLVYSLGREYAPFNVMAGTFRTELAERSQKPIEFHEVSLETARSGQGENEQPLVDYLRALFSKRRLDLIVTLGGPAALFANRHRDRLFPSVPMIITMDRRRLAETGLVTNTVAVPMQLNPPGLIEDILQTLPATTNIVVTLGDSPLSRYWAQQCKLEFAPFTNRMRVTYYNDLSLDKMCEEVQKLPPNSAILYGNVIMDAAGVPHEQDTALTALRASARSPIFGVYAHQLGLGIVGGRLTSCETWGRCVADAALRILNGESVSKIQPRPTGPGTPVYDWRELQRWGIGLDRLPPGASIRFREPGQWEQHKWLFLGGTALCLVEATLIAGLVLQLRKRHRAEAVAQESALAARELSGRLIHAQEEERSRIARDLHDDFNQRLALLSVEIDLLSRTTSATDSAARLQQLGGHARELATDMHRLAYQLHPAKLDQLGLVAAVSGLCRDLSQKAGLNVEFTHRGVRGDLPADVARCAFRVVQESLQNTVRHSGAKEARVELRAENGHIRLVVSDAGQGFDPEAKSKTAGLGLLSMRERVRLSKGNLKIRSEPGRGTRVELTIPLPKEETAA